LAARARRAASSSAGSGDVARDRGDGARQIAAQLAGTADPNANARLLAEVPDPIGAFAASCQQIERAADLGEPDLDRPRQPRDAPGRRQVREIRRHSDQIGTARASEAAYDRSSSMTCWKVGRLVAGNR